MSSQITPAQLFNIHSLAHTLGTCVWIPVVVTFLQFTPTESCNGIPPLSRGYTIRAFEGGPKEHRNQAKMAA